MTILDLSVTPFSFFGSYLSIKILENSLYICSLHGKSKGNMPSIKIIPTFNEKEIPYTIKATYTQITVQTNNGTINICFDSSERLIFTSSSPTLGLRFDTCPKYNFEYSYFFKGTSDSNSYCIVNSYKNLTKYLIYPTNGKITLNQKINIDTTGSFKESENISLINITPNNSGFLCVVEDIPTNMLIPNKNKINYLQCLENSQKDFAKFTENLPLNNTNYQKTILDAAYILWSSTVKPEGYLKHHSIYASNKDFPGVWSWDNCFIAMGVLDMDKELAWKQLRVLFDYQDDYGQIPGSISDSSLRWNFSKPPVQGFFFDKLMDYIDFSEDRLLLIENWIEKQVNFYFNFKDSNHDTICEYHHGNDSGQDNSTIFSSQVPVDSPDLTAFIIKALDLLVKIAIKLNHKEKEQKWSILLQDLIEKFHEYFIDKNNLPHALETNSGKIIYSDSILPYVSLILGKHLKPAVREAMLHKIKNDFSTEFGIATEAPSSSNYSDDAYWRGPIWAPTTFLFFEALNECGDENFALEIAEKFCNMVKKYGFAENFDAKKGIGLRDKSFCWTAATFLFLVNKVK